MGRAKMAGSAQGELGSFTQTYAEPEAYVNLLRWYLYVMRDGSAIAAYRNYFGYSLAD